MLTGPISTKTCNLGSSISNPSLSKIQYHTNINENFEVKIPIIPIFYEENELEFIDQNQEYFKWARARLIEFALRLMRTQTV